MKRISLDGTTMKIKGEKEKRNKEIKKG